MNSNCAIRELVGRAGVSLRNASIQMGKSPTFLSSTLTNNASCECATIAALASVCNYSLVLVPRDSVPNDAIVIDE